MDLRFFIALFVGKITAYILFIYGSGATAAPGLYALKIDPQFVKKISKQIKNGSIIITGTNGKTTTSRLAYEMLSPKYNIIHNRQGSNLLRGIASTLIVKSSLLGLLDYDMALWEVDEAVLPASIDNTFPNTIVFLNLFRDQLDRYGEIESIKKLWLSTLKKIDNKINVIANIDDPLINYLKENYPGKIITYGINDKKINLPINSPIKDLKYCPKCQSKILYSAEFSSHQGHYKCSKCEFSRPQPIISALNINILKGFKSTYQINYKNMKISINSNLPGVYSIYNILAASAISIAKNIDSNKIISVSSSHKAVFGRSQSINIEGKNIRTLLIKNPTGANEILRILSIENNAYILIILNDNIADGRDVSWIWDTVWETLNKKDIFISGNRSWDQANRLKYAGHILSNNRVHKDIYYSIKNILGIMNNNDTLFILPTYTALLEVQKSLSSLTKIQKWHKN